MGNVIRHGRKTHPSVPQERSEHDVTRVTCVMKWSYGNKDGSTMFPTLANELAKAMNVNGVQEGSVTSKTRPHSPKGLRRFCCQKLQFPATLGAARRLANVNDRPDDGNGEARLPKGHPKPTLKVIHHGASNIFHECVRLRDVKLIPLFVHAGLDIDEMDTSSQTALHVASKILTTKTIQMLLRCGANVNLAAPTTGQSALHFAVQSSSTKGAITLAAGAECVELLLKSGAQVSMRDRKGKEAIHLACKGGREDLVSLLLRYGADINSLTDRQESPLFVFLEGKKNLRNTRLLHKLLSLSYPLKITNAEGRLPAGLILPSARPLKDTLLRMTSDVLTLQEICKFTIRKRFGGNMKYWTEMKLPANLWKSIYINQEFSYALKIKQTHI